MPQRRPVCRPPRGGSRSSEYGHGAEMETGRSPPFRGDPKSARGVRLWSYTRTVRLVENGVSQTGGRPVTTAASRSNVSLLADSLYVYRPAGSLRSNYEIY